MTWNPQPKTTHVDQGLSRLLEQFRGKSKLEALLRSYLRRIQELEDATWEVITLRALDVAEDAALDMLGRIVGRGRGDLSDEDYRIALRAQIRINRSSGTTEDLIAVGVLSLPSGFALSLTEHYPAAVTIQVDGAVTWAILVLWQNLVTTKAAGVRLFLLWSQAAPADSFTFASQTSPQETSDDLGYGDSLTVGVGGQLQSVIAS
jgi:hypothetical protein